jgi:hypothetical protein
VPRLPRMVEKLETTSAGAFTIQPVPPLQLASSHRITP